MQPTPTQEEIMELKLAVMTLEKYKVPGANGVKNVLKQEISDKGGKV